MSTTNRFISPSHGETVNGNTLSALLSPLSPQAGYITVNYDYELWAVLERRGARFLTRPSCAHLLEDLVDLVDHPRCKEKNLVDGCVF